MKRVQVLAVMMSGAMFSSVGFAGTFDVSALAAQGQGSFKSLVEDFAAATSYKAVTPAAPLGGGLIPVGVDVGVEVTATELASKDAYVDLLKKANIDVSYLPLPKLHAHVGVPFGIDLGLVYAGYPPAEVSMYGGELRYSFMKGNLALPAVSLRGTFSQFTGGDTVKITNYGYELTASKGFGVGIVLTPYLGLGQVFSTGSSDYEAVPGTKLFSDVDVTSFKWFLGAGLKLGIMNVDVEMDQTGDAQSYSLKLGLRW